MSAHDGLMKWNPLTEHPDVFVEYEELRNRCPVVHSDAFGGYWMLNRYEDVMAAATDPITFASAPSIFVENDTTHSFRSIPITLNRPEHTQYRRVLDPFFRIQRVKAFEPTLRRLAIEQLAPIFEAGEGDFVREIAYPFPARVLCALLGLNDSLWPIVKQVTPGSDKSALTSEQIEQFRAFILDVIEERRLAPRDPKEDLLSAVIEATIDDAPIDASNVVRIVHQLFTAGHTTSAHALGNAIGFIANDDELQEHLRQDITLLPSAIEEFLRLKAPLHQIARVAANDANIGGVEIRAGEQVVLNFASANRDEQAFNSPNSLEITRSPNRHATFGSGIHKCLGAAIARLELRVVLEELLTRTSSIEFAGIPRIIEYAPGNHFISGFEELPIRLTVRH